MSKKKKITDFTIVKVLLKFESDAIGLFKNMPVTYRYTIEKEFFDALSNTIRLAVKSMKTPPMDETLMQQKYYMLVEGHSELCYAETRLIQLNDNGAISEKVKIGLDLQLYDIYENFDRLESSLLKNIGGPEPYGCAHMGVPVVIGMPDCDGEIGSNA